MASRVEASAGRHRQPTPKPTEGVRRFGERSRSGGYRCGKAGGRNGPKPESVSVPAMPPHQDERIYVPKENYRTGHASMHCSSRLTHIYRSLTADSDHESSLTAGEGRVGCRGPAIGAGLLTAGLVTPSELIRSGQGERTLRTETSLPYRLYTGVATLLPAATPVQRPPTGENGLPRSPRLLP